LEQDETPKFFLKIRRIILICVKKGFFLQKYVCVYVSQKKPDGI